MVTRAAGSVSRRLYVGKEVSKYARPGIYHEIPWLVEVVSAMTLFNGDTHTHARAQAETSLHASPSSATYRVKTLAPKENPRPNSGARG